MLTRQGPNGHLTGYWGRHAVCTMARHHKQRQSCNLPNNRKKPYFET